MGAWVQALQSGSGLSAFRGVMSCAQSMRRSTSSRLRAQAHWRTRVAPSRQAASSVVARTWKTEATLFSADTVKKRMQPG